MNGPSGINPWANINTTQPTNKIKRAVPPEVQERMMLAKLFGHKDEPAAPPPAQPATQPPDDDEFAPNLGRNLDVIA